MMKDENGKKPDGRRFNGGNRNAGRKPKTHTSELINKLAQGDDDIIPIIIEKAKAGDREFIKIWSSYRFGTPNKADKDADTGTRTFSHQELFNKLRYDFEEDDSDEDDNFFED